VKPVKRDEQEAAMANKQSLTPEERTKVKATLADSAKALGPTT